MSEASRWLAALLPPLLLGLGLVLLSLGAAAAGLLWARRRQVAVDRAPPRTRLEWALAAAIALELFAVAGVSFRTRLSWDALVVAETQARPAWMRGESASRPMAGDEARRPRFGRVELLPALEAWCFG